MKGPIYHLVRSSTHERTLCNRPPSLGALSIATAGIAIRYQLHLCGTCVGQFHEIRYDREHTYRPERARSRLTA